MDEVIGLTFDWRQRVADRDDGRLLRDVLRGSMGISQRLLHALKFEGEITVNGQPVTVRARVRSGDEVRLRLEEAADQRVIPEQLPLKLVHEDADILVVDKPAGSLVHPVPPEPTGTLANAVAWYFQEQGLHQPVRVVTRLDRDTSGLVLIAKHALAQHFYASNPDAVTKHYLALATGQLTATSGLIDAPIGINPDNPVTRQIDLLGKPAQTSYQVLRQSPLGSLLALQLLTGRTHQIRVHLAAIGHPLLGDSQYGGSRQLIARQALHSAELHLRQVRSGKLLDLCCALPPDMRLVSSLLFSRDFSEQ